MYLMAAFALARHGRGGLGAGANIGAVLADQHGKVLGWGVNTNKVNYCYHAEVNAVQGFLKRGGVVGVTRYFLYTTLKPCCMCAAVLYRVFGDRITVYYGMDDGGQHA